MELPSFVTVRIEQLAAARTRAERDLPEPPASRFHATGFDERDAIRRGVTGRSWTWLSLALHDDAASAAEAFAALVATTPGGEEPTASWSALLQPFSHRGEVNWLGSAGAVVATGPAPDDHEPVVVITTAGWDHGPALDVSRMVDFGDAVDRVYDAMHAAPGLRARHVFTLTDRRLDPVTITSWDGDSAMRGFAYRAGRHRTEMERYRELRTADRTSFTRLRVLEHAGELAPTAAAQP